MEALLYFIVWAVIIFAMLRLGAGASVMGYLRTAGRNDAPGNDGGLRWAPPKKDVDPVCGKTVATAAAKPSIFDGQVFYFCSRDCREIFEAAPQLYVATDRAIAAPNLDHGHVQS